MEPIDNICPISERRHEEVPIDKIKVINSETATRITLDKPEWTAVIPSDARRLAGKSNRRYTT